MTRITPVPIEERLDHLPVYHSGTASPAWWGMILFIATEAMLFACALASLFYLRTTMGLEAEQIHPPSLRLPAANTLLLVASSFTLWLGERGIRRGDVARLQIGTVATILLGIAFLVVQGIEYAKKPPPTLDAYHSVFHVITGIHGSHVAMGLLMVAFLLVQSARRQFDEHRHVAVTNVALYWHFVDAVWLTIFAVVYLWPSLT